MKFRRQLRALLRASFHVAIVLAPLAAIPHVSGWTGRWVLIALAVLGVALLVRAAFIYIPGFDPLFRVPWRGPKTGRRMAITFDDGPNGAFTQQVLALLERHQAKATFFMIGQNVDRQPDLARQVARAGHAVGSHTYSHQKLHAVSLAQAAGEIERGHAALVAAGLPDQRLFRAPHGLKTFSVVRHLAAKGLRLVAWTAGVFDTDCPRADVIARRARRFVRPGAILLLHDGKFEHDRRPMVEALAEILQTAAQRRIALVTIPELLGWQ